VAEARRFGAGLARSLDFGEADIGRLAIAVTEAGTNLVKHGGGGDLVFNALQNGRRSGIEMLALDRGPGILDLPGSLRDGYSTTGSPGTGLGAIARLSSRFDIYSSPEQGTGLVAEFWPGVAALSLESVEVGGLSVPKPGQDVCGDGWAASCAAEGARVLIVDGVGHGFDAAEAAAESVRAFQASRGLGPVEVLEQLNSLLRHTRGAVAAMAVIDVPRGRVRFAGIGNISAAVLTPDRTYNMVSLNGTLGHQVRKIHEFTYPWPAGALMVLHSDGLSEKWRLEDYPRLVSRHPTLIAGILFRDHRRERDDATIIAVKPKAEASR
jgi:anti-sigma regulatory factor (Ser/Thr protein kinase)